MSLQQRLLQEGSRAVEEKHRRIKAEYFFARAALKVSLYSQRDECGALLLANDGGEKKTPLKAAFNKCFQQMSAEQTADLFHRAP